MKINIKPEIKGNALQTLNGHLNTKQLPLEASFSPDSQFIISGSTDGRIHIWNTENGQKVSYFFFLLCPVPRIWIRWIHNILASWIRIHKKASFYI